MKTLRAIMYALIVLVVISACGDYNFSGDARYDIPEQVRLIQIPCASGPCAGCATITVTDRNLPQGFRVDAAIANIPAIYSGGGATYSGYFDIGTVALPPLPLSLYAEASLLRPDDAAALDAITNVILTASQFDVCYDIPIAFDGDVRVAVKSSAIEPVNFATRYLE